MRSSIVVASLCAAFAAASPLVKKGLEIAAPAAQVVETHVDVVTNVVMVTVTGEPVIVTAGAESTPAPVVVTVTAPAQSRPHRHSHSQAAPAPAPTTTSQAVVVVTETQAPATYAAAPATNEAAAAKVVEVTTSSAAPVAATTEAASATDALSPTCVAAHNNARASHKASAMTWNQTLADYAAQEGSCTKFAHDLTAGGGGYGQNIAVSGNSNSGAFTTEAALADHIQQWYEEESLFGSLYGVANPSEAVGDFLHFTQIVWQGSRQVGCAVKTCGTDNSIYPGMYIWYSVCNYYPAGNVIGEFATNVLS
ncbi:uncharacterized protein EAE97_008770 [Botrytis byssoidea]|uniref:SCP domain-containing protein n=1 Tax=Botrytis byssoidea TaxID=139641 RepID=A0A9P5LXP7_9HELO|nr:uncharacterized protein EAE97_008770 [Botrytis byssoidea]KAF7933003.1 hypothetical protein EAE97_008770 [Botrytis byssoidea]